MQPGRQRLSGMYSGGFASQNQENRLKGVLGVVSVTQNPSAHLQH
jgi:hypothetical protein